MTMPTGTDASLYRTVVANAAVGIVQADALGRMNFVNERWCRMLGYSEGELIGRSITDITDPALLPQTLDVFSRLAAGESEVIIEKNYTRKDGSILPASSIVSALRGESGAFEGIVAVVIDATERRRAEDELRQTEDRLRTSEARMQLAMTVGDAGTWDLDFVTGVLHWSESHFRLLGYEPTATGKAEMRMWQDAIHPEDVDALMREWNRAERERDLFQSEHRIRHADGNYIWAQAAGRFFYDERGNAIRFVGVFFDITERKRAEEALQLGERRLRLATEGAGVGIWEIDLQTGGGVWSPEAAAMLGLSRASFTNDDWLDALHPEDRANATEAWRQAIETGGLYECEYRSACPAEDGGTRWILAKGRAELGPDGRARRGAGVMLDVTARRRAQQELADLRAREISYLNHLPVGIWFVSADGRIEYGNAAAQQIWEGVRNVGQAQFNEYKGWWHDTGKELGADDWAAARAIRRGETSLNEEIDIQCFDGARKTILNSAVPVRDQEGAVIGAVIFNQDITDRKRVEGRLRQSEERFRHLADSMPQLVWVAQSNGRVIYYNSQAGRYAGIEKLGEAEGGTWIWQPVVHADDLDATVAAWREAIATGATYQQEHRIHMADGTYRWHLSRAHPVGSPESRQWFGTATDVHDLKTAQETLRRNEEQLRLITDTLPALISYVDARERYVFVNRGYEQWFKQPSNSLRGRTLQSVLGPVGYERIQEFVKRALAGEAQAFEIKMPTPSGEKHSDVRYVPDISNSGEVRGFYALVVDVTEQRRIESAFRSSEERFQSFMKYAPVLAFIKDARGRYVFVNRRVEESYDRPLAEWVGRTDREIFSSVEANQYQRNDREVLETGKTSQYAETSFQNDEPHHYLAFKFRLENEEGERFVAGMTIDVTALRNAEDALRASEERIREQFAELDTLYKSTPHGLCFFDLDFRYRRLNERLAEMNGIPHQSHLGRTPYELVPDLAVKAEPIFRKVLETNEHLTLELAGQTAADPGKEHVWLETWFPVRDDGGLVLGVAVVIEDITDRKRMEEELTLHREQLQVLVEQRTAELEASRQRLQIAERMASLGTLSAGLGHDMGNLLVPVRVRLESLTRMELPEEARQDLLAIRSSAEYLQRLANGLRLLALDPKRSQSQNATELHAWLAEAVTVLKNVLPRGMSLETELPEGECWVNISKAALMQVVFNLVQNAGDAMRAQATGVVCITAKRLAESVELRIRDTGPGMSEEVRRRCMEPFFTTKSRGISTGLGLALVFGLIQDAGGRVQLESEPGKGTEFILSLRPGRVVTPTSTDGRARAVVSLRDARQRAIVTTELRNLQYEVEVTPGGAPDAAVVVTDSTEGIEGFRGKLILLAETTTRPASAVVLGARPKIQELRAALRQIQESGLMNAKSV